MFSTISLLASTLAFNLTAIPVQAQNEPLAHSLLGGVLLGFAGDAGVKVAAGDCLGVEIDAGAKCGVLAGASAHRVCDPLSVEAACLAELGGDSGVQAFADCTTALTDHCEAELVDGGALFCDGNFIGADTCLGAIDVDVTIDPEACVAVDLADDVDAGVSADLCMTLDLRPGARCEKAVGAVCHVKCDPVAVAAACEGQLDGAHGELHAYAACQAAAMEQCNADCDAGGALFCDENIYAGDVSCVGHGLGVGLGL